MKTLQLCWKYITIKLIESLFINLSYGSGQVSGTSASIVPNRYIHDPGRYRQKRQVQLEHPSPLKYELTWEQVVASYMPRIYTLEQTLSKYREERDVYPQSERVNLTTALEWIVSPQTNREKDTFLSETEKLLQQAIATYEKHYSGKLTHYHGLVFKYYYKGIVLYFSKKIPGIDFDMLLSGYRNDFCQHYDEICDNIATTKSELATLSQEFESYKKFFGKE